MYNIHEDASSEHHTYFDNSTTCLDPSIVLGDLAKKRFRDCREWVTYKYTSKIDEENGKGCHKIKENSLIDLSETPVFRKACGSNNLGHEGGCEGIPTGVNSYRMIPITRPDLTSRPRRPPTRDLRLQTLVQTP